MFKVLIFWHLLAISTSTLAQGIPSSEWSQAEQKWVNEARTLYQSQGLEFNDTQAAEAVFKMRNKSLRGIPSSEWTPLEHKMVLQMRGMYQKRNMQLSEEHERIQVQTMREKLAKISGSIGAIQALADGSISLNTAPTVSPELPSSSTSAGIQESEMAARMAAYPKINGTIDIHGRRDGFDVNGVTVLDAEGRITSYAYDVLTGDITYIVQSANNFAIKFMRAGTDAPPILIANAVNSRSGEWEITTVTGKKLAGQTLNPTPLGFVVGRDTSAFRYETGKGVRNISIPEGYLLAPLQHGDIGSTGYILLEMDESDSKAKGVKGLANTFKSLGSTLGLNKKEDYALMEVDTGKLYPLNMSSDGKRVLKMSNCRKKNNVINECSTATSFESIYSPDGTPNMGHYYWRANWFKTPSGPIAITMENGLKDIYITELKTGKKVVGFNRTLGIQSFTTKQHSDGHLSIAAYWAFNTHEIPDVEAHLKNSENIAIVTSVNK